MKDFDLMPTSLNPLVLKIPDCPVVFYVPFSRLPLSSYAELTNQTKRAVQQQAGAGRLPLIRDTRGKERQVNMLYQFLDDYYDAVEKLNNR